MFTLDLDIDDNRVIITAGDHEQAVTFAAALTQLFMDMGPEHVIVKEDDEPVQ